MATRVCPHCGVEGAFGLGTEVRPFDPATESFIHLETCRNSECGGTVAVVTKGVPARECESFPGPAEDISDFLPDGVKTAYQQARQSLRAKIYDATVLMCLRALEEAADALGAKGKSLEDRVLSITRDEGIPGILRDWAQSNDLRNMLKSRGSGSDRPDAEELAQFCKRFFEYAFVMPANVDKSRRSTGRHGGAQRTSFASPARVSSAT